MGQLTGRRILVVEDEPLIAMTIVDMIADLGGSCAVAPSVAAALALIAVETFDAAVLDLNLNGETSVPVGALLRESGIPFAYATGYGGSAADTAAAPVLAKPYVQEDLARALLGLLGA
ncbi:MAG TPA: response regulator [Caulobacterales bacterium]|nr:response regulator [Caulobacterales bacterium]